MVNSKVVALALNELEALPSTLARDMRRRFQVLQDCMKKDWAEVTFAVREVAKNDTKYYG